MRSYLIIPHSSLRFYVEAAKFYSLAEGRCAFRLPSSYNRRSNRGYVNTITTDFMPTIEELLQQSLSSLKASFLDQGDALPKGLLEALENDSRRGARELAGKLRARLQANRAEGQRLRHLLKFENELWAQGFST